LDQNPIIIVERKGISATTVFNHATLEEVEEAEDVVDEELLI
jgi:hypothetical protein